MKRKPRADFRARYGPWAIVAGASAGLGAAFAEQIAAQGLNLVLVARRPDLLEQVGARLVSNCAVQVRTIALDLARDDATARVAAAAEGLGVGLLVYNAGYAAIGPFLDRPLEDHLREIATNCRTPLGLAYTFGQPMRKRGRGGIILMSSLSAVGLSFDRQLRGHQGLQLVVGRGLVGRAARRGSRRDGLPRGLAIRLMGRVLRRLYAGHAVDGRTADPMR